MFSTFCLPVELRLLSKLVMLLETDICLDISLFKVDLTSLLKKQNNKLTSIPSKLERQQSNKIFIFVIEENSLSWLYVSSGLKVEIPITKLNAIKWTPNKGINIKIDFTNLIFLEVLSATILCILPGVNSYFVVTIKLGFCLSISLWVMLKFLVEFSRFIFDETVLTTAQNIIVFMLVDKITGIWGIIK